jgi:hypothetical protein
MRVCYFGTYDQDYPRNRIVREGLRRNGVEVTECHRVLWAGTADKIARASGGWKQAGFLGKLIVTYLALAGDYARVGDHDVVLVGYAGLLDIYLAWLLTRFSRRPLVLDALLSVYNSIVNERKLAGPSSLKARVVYTLEQNACRLADRVLLDTQAHIHYFCELYGLEESRFVMVPIAPVCHRSAKGWPGTGCVSRSLPRQVRAERRRGAHPRRRGPAIRRSEHHL